MSQVPRPNSLRDFYAFEDHVATANRNRGRDVPFTTVTGDVGAKIDRTELSRGRDGHVDREVAERRQLGPQHRQHCHRFCFAMTKDAGAIFSILDHNAPPSLGWLVIGT